MRAVRLLLAGILLLGACTRRASQDASDVRRTDTLARYKGGTPQIVTVSRGDSVLERRTYRPTGRLSKIEAGDSVRTYLDLHKPDSAVVLRDYLQGRWRNLSADTSNAQSSVYYVFTPDELTFENSSRRPLESLNLSYENNRTLITGKGMRVQADITSFDTVRVTGYTLVRLPATDSLP
ncbi:MAG: hypothetical protein BRD55_11450 [Bacteroidetes bacterium SW_9_63_38]|nr:MAG: hypothetical protein BRD55_11450 [Bacteroidetes bacterium SW_9_63_38]